MVMPAWANIVRLCPPKRYVFKSLKCKYGCSSISLTGERQMCMGNRAKEVQRGLEIKENGCWHEEQQRMRGGVEGARMDWGRKGQYFSECLPC